MAGLVKLNDSANFKWPVLLSGVYINGIALINDASASTNVRRENALSDVYCCHLYSITLHVWLQNSLFLTKSHLCILNGSALWVVQHRR